jgi:L-ascorbate metabolism protein UlaG (beta-lactamase superfamily)
MTETAGDVSLLGRLTELPLRPDRAALCHLGQSGFALRGGGQTILVDPFLSEHPDRLVPPAFDPSEAEGLDAVLCTHEHWDHLDADAVRALAEACPRAVVVVPAPVVEQVTALGIPAERVRAAQPDELILIDDVAVQPVPACHGLEPADAYSFGKELSDGLYRYLGYVVELGGVRVYHAGDTIPFEGLVERLRQLEVDVVLLPINGRDAAREAQGIVGNLDEVEAAHLAADAAADLLVPMHYDMFEANPGFPERVVETVRSEELAVSVLVPERGRVFVYTAAGR